MRKQKFFLATMIVFYKDGKYLLTRRRDDNKKYDKKWQFPGGGWEPGESLKDAIKRETKEELGIELKKYKFLPKIFEEVREKYHLIFFVFYAPFPKGIRITLNEEADKYEWFTLEEVKKLPSLPLTNRILQELDKCVSKLRK